MILSAETVPAAPGWCDRAASLALPATSPTFAVLALVAWQYPPALGVPKYIIPRLSERSLYPEYCVAMTARGSSCRPDL